MNMIGVTSKNKREMFELLLCNLSRVNLNGLYGKIPDITHVYYYYLCILLCCLIIIIIPLGLSFHCFMNHIPRALTFKY